jgi:hypothetical protein
LYFLSDILHTQIQIAIVTDHTSNMDRTNIIEDDEFVLAMAAAGKKGKGKKKATGGSASSPPKSQKASGVPTARGKAKAAASHNTGARFYEADGLKIPLFNSVGRKRISRSWKTVSKKNFEELLEIVEEYAGANKKGELRNRGSSKTELAQWIEAQETLAFKHDTKTSKFDIATSSTTCHNILTVTVTDAQQDNAEQFDHRGPTFASSASSPTKKANKPTVAGPVASAKDAKSQTAAKEDGMCHHPVDKKRRAPDEPAYGQPHQKQQKRDHQANLQTTSTGPPTKDNHTDKQDYDVIPALLQTVAQTTSYNNTDDGVRGKVTFMNGVGMHPDDPDRSSKVVKGRSEDRILTATKSTKSNGTEQVTLHEVSGMYSSMFQVLLITFRSFSPVAWHLEMIGVLPGILRTSMFYRCFPPLMSFAMLTIN